MCEARHDDGGNFPKLQIKAVLTVPPLTVTDTEHRSIRQVKVSESMNGSNRNLVVGGYYQIVLYLRDSVKEEEDAGGILAGWAVESLGKALSDHPLLAGRLRRREEDEGDSSDRGLEIVSNDCGIRVVVARIPVTMSEFLGLNDKDDAHDVEGELVFWKELDHHSPQFSPLVYVQVTSFECGGYSIGISCSLLVAEFFMVHNFLKKWADTHSNIQTQNDHTNYKTPIFYYSRLKTPQSPPTHIITQTPTKLKLLTAVFKVIIPRDEEHQYFNQELWRELALRCVEEAEQKLERNMGENFSLLFLVRESSSSSSSCEVIRVESWSKIKRHQCSGLEIMNQICCTTWDDFGEYEVAFDGGSGSNKPLHVSRWIGSVCEGEGHVMVVPYPREGVSAVIIVSLPIGEHKTHT